MAKRQIRFSESIWDAFGYAKDPKNFFNRDGRCECFEVFKKFWDLIPNAPFSMHIRNFNKIDGRITISMRFSGIGSGHLYFHNANLVNFFPADFVRFLTEEEQNSKSISAPFLIKIGDLIAKSTCREFSVIHQEGGNQDTAAFTTYGPFFPGKFSSFDFDPKDVFGFFSPNGFIELDLFGESA